MLVGVYDHSSLVLPQNILYPVRENLTHLHTLNILSSCSSVPCVRFKWCVVLSLCFFIQTLFVNVTIMIVFIVLLMVRDEIKCIHCVFLHTNTMVWYGWHHWSLFLWNPHNSCNHGKIRQQLKKKILNKHRFLIINIIIAYFEM